MYVYIYDNSNRLAFNRTEATCAWTIICLGMVVRFSASMSKNSLEANLGFKVPVTLCRLDILT